MQAPVSTYFLSIPDGSASKKQMALQAMEARYPHLKFEVARVPYPDDEAACIPFLGVVGDGVARPAIAMPTPDVIRELNAALAEALEGALLN